MTAIRAQGPSANAIRAGGLPRPIWSRSPSPKVKMSRPAKKGWGTVRNDLGYGQDPFAKTGFASSVTGALAAKTAAAEASAAEKAMFAEIENACECFQEGIRAIPALSMQPPSAQASSRSTPATTSSLLRKHKQLRKRDILLVNPQSPQFTDASAIRITIPPFAAVDGRVQVH